MRADQIDGLDAVRSLRQHGDAAGRIQQVLQLLPRQRLVIDDQRRRGDCIPTILTRVQPSAVEEPGLSDSSFTH